MSRRLVRLDPANSLHGSLQPLRRAALTDLRDRLMASLHVRLTGPTSAGVNGRTVQFQQRTDDICKELAQVNLKLDRRTGRIAAGGPIYLV